MLQNVLEPTVEGGPDRKVRGRVLNATSGSAASTNATAAAVIASEREAELIVVHVCTPVVMRVGRLAPTIVHHQRPGDPHGNRVLSSARQVAWAHGAFARVILVSGDPAPAIVSLARELDVELVVIGTAPSRVPVVIAARTRYRVQRDSPCPVRVVALGTPARAPQSIRTVPAT
jgi:nucleotide-binding universal stress UspA family protein